MSRHHLLLALFVASACVDDGGAEVTAKRGAPQLGNANKADIKDDGAVKRSGTGAEKAAPAKPKPAMPAAAAEEEEAPVALPPRPKVALDGRSFQLRRDPFLNFAPGELTVP